MTSYFLTPQAVQDLEEIYDYIAIDNVNAALRFVDLLEEKFLLLTDSPGIGRHRNELASALRSFPAGNYIIFYRPVGEVIQIIRVLHGARDIEAVFED